MPQPPVQKRKASPNSVFIFTAAMVAPFLYFAFLEVSYSLFGAWAVAKVTHKTQEQRSNGKGGGSHPVLVLTYSFQEASGNQRSERSDVGIGWTLGPDETVPIEYIPGVSFGSRVKGAKSPFLALVISGIFAGIGIFVTWLIKRHQAKAAVELEPLTQSESSKTAGDSSADRPQPRERKRFAPGVPKFSDEALVCRCAGWMGKPVSVIVDRAKGMIHFQNCLTLRKFLAVSAEPWFSCPLSELTATLQSNQ